MKWDEGPPAACPPSWRCGCNQWVGPLACMTECPGCAALVCADCREGFCWSCGEIFAADPPKEGGRHAPRD